MDTSAPLHFLLELVRGNRPISGESRETSSPSISSSSPVCTAPGLAAGGIQMTSIPNPDMRTKGKVLSRSVSTNDLNMDTSSDSQRKRQSADGEGFIHPPKSKTAKVVKSSTCQNPISTSNTFEILATEKAVAGPSGVSGIPQGGFRP